VPSTVQLTHQWTDGTLSCTLRNLTVHAALVLGGIDTGPCALLPADTLLNSRNAFAHYPPEYPIFDDFEVAGHGHQLDPLRRYSIRAKGETAIELSRETASSGKCSLKFTDSPNAPADFFPYLVWRPRGLDRGACVFQTDIKLDAAAQATIEFREVENRREYPVGPSVTLKGNGEVSAGSEGLLTTLPPGDWWTVTIRVPLDSDNYELTLAARDSGRTFSRKGLPVAKSPFRKCGWIGIIGSGTAKSVFYVDNLKLDRE